LETPVEMLLRLLDRGMLRAKTRTEATRRAVASASNGVVFDRYQYI
jgi:hypothetical protein